MDLVRRLLNALTMCSLMMLAVTAGVWGLSYFTAFHLGSFIHDIDRYGTTREYRRGLFIASGQVSYARGTHVLWLTEGDRPSPVRESHLGLFIGDFEYWATPDDWPLGFGYLRSGASTPTVGYPSTLGDLTIVSTWIGMWALLFTALPVWRWVGRRYQLGGGVGAMVLGTYAVLLLNAALSIAEPRLGQLVRLYVVLAAAWICGGLVYRRWRSDRAQRRAGRCRVCGYDLRATPDPAGPLLERCPECGTYSRPLRSG